MKLKDIREWSGRWSTPSGSLEANAAAEDGVLVNLSRWGVFVIGLTIECPDGRYFGSIRVTRDVYDRVL